MNRASSIHQSRFICLPVGFAMHHGVSGMHDTSTGSRGGRRLFKSPFRRRNVRPRALSVVAAALIVVLYARPTFATLVCGLALLIAGEGLRVWATGHLVKTDRLTVAGPYAYIRHPLYAGSLLIGFGLLVGAGVRVATVGVPLGLGFFFLYYLPRKESVESARLRARYGSAFDEYRSSVPQLLPQLRRFAGPTCETAWSFARVLENDEVGTALGVSLVLAALLLRVLSSHGA
jgi:protein-S-isoprenylcysteine O-methyltransferase Ste14